MEIVGAAQYPKSWPWKKNADGPRTITEAVALACRCGVVIPDDVEFIVDEWNLITDPNLDARYLNWRGLPTDVIPWSAFYRPDGKITALVRPYVLESDAAIVAVFAHEMYELNELRVLFAANNGVMVAQRLGELVDQGIPRNLHDQAWEFADQLVKKMGKNHGNS